MHLCRATKTWKSDTIKIQFAASDETMRQRFRSSMDQLEFDFKRGRAPKGQLERELEKLLEKEK